MKICEGITRYVDDVSSESVVFVLASDYEQVGCTLMTTGLYWLQIVLVSVQENQTDFEQF